MSVSIAGRTVARGAVDAGLGAVLAMVSTVLVWASYTQGGPDMGGPKTEAVTGLDYTNGKVVLGLGLVVLALVVAWLKGIKIGGLRAMVAVFGALILLVLLLSYFTAGLFYPNTMPVLAFTGKEDLASALGEFNRMVDAVKAAGGDTSGSSAGLGFGFFFEIVAGIAIVSGGLLGLLDERRATGQTQKQTP
jgi:hypothetical protein